LAAVIAVAARIPMLHIKARLTEALFATSRVRRWRKRLGSAAVFGWQPRGGNSRASKVGSGKYQLAACESSGWPTLGVTASGCHSFDGPRMTGSKAERTADSVKGQCRFLAIAVVGAPNLIGWS